MGKKIFLVLLFPALFSFTNVGGPFLSWSKLENIDFTEKYVKEVEGYMLFPKFPDYLKKLDGKQVTVEGYVVPVDKSGASIALSANPYAACFFCGKAGPASVMTVKLKTKNTKYKIDDYIKFTGILRLNDNDIKEFYYILEQAVEIK
jgi:hypothetical protein